MGQGGHPSLLESPELRDRLSAIERAGAMALVAGILVHDANNAITLIMATADELVRASNGVDQALASDLNDGCMRLSNILRRLQSLQQSGAESRIIRIDEAVTDLASMLRTLAGKARRLTLRLDGGLPPVRMDPAELERSLINLVANARDATAPGDEVVIGARLVTLTAAERGIPEGSWVVASVSDRGAGMDAETLSRATEPFFTTKGSDRGTGLGLFSVARCMDSARGHLTILSKRGEGTTVELWLPTMGQPTM